MALAREHCSPSPSRVAPTRVPPPRIRFDPSPAPPASFVGNLEIRCAHRTLVRDRASEYVWIRRGAEAKICHVDGLDPAVNSNRSKSPRENLVDEEASHLLHRVDFFFL